MTHPRKPQRGDIMVFFGTKRIAILGFGMEGRSTYKLIRRYFPEQHINICDQNDTLPGNQSDAISDKHVSWHLGAGYLSGLDGADIIMKSPGIPYKALHGIPPERITSQTAIFLELYRKQVIGITGTKGKSTTASLLHYILIYAGKPSLLAGNIGKPCFDLLDKITEDSIIVFEMSSHQLEQLKISPQVAILLNVFREHLDHYQSFDAYRDAKFNIARWQQPGDYFICNIHNENIAGKKLVLNLPGKLITLGGLSEDGRGVFIDDSDIVIAVPGKQLRLPGAATVRLLPGEHNLLNIAAAAGAAVLMGVTADHIADAIKIFPGLPHRLEHVGTFNDVSYYNDSIATIPEACMEAVKAVPAALTLILGGHDRGLDYHALMEFLSESCVQKMFFTGEAGRRMHDLVKQYAGFSGKTCRLVGSFDEAVQAACRATPAGKAVLLSPAASSYDTFRDFKERGERFKTLVKQFAT